MRASQLPQMPICGKMRMTAGGGNPHAALRTALGQLDGQLDSLVTARGRVGSYLQREESASQWSRDIQSSAKNRYSDLVETDMPQAIMELQKNNVVQQAANVRASAKDVAFQLSLRFYFHGLGRARVLQKGHFTGVFDGYKPMLAVLAKPVNAVALVLAIVVDVQFEPWRQARISMDADAWSR